MEESGRSDQRQTDIYRISSGDRGFIQLFCDINIPVTRHMF